jgi:FkbM family methyltransferase
MFAFRWPRVMTTIAFLWKHPLNREQRIWALRRWIRFQVARRTAPGPFLVPFVGQARIVVQGGDHASLIVYTGPFDVNEMLFVVHLLQAQDLFVDVGANVGIYSVLASAVAGARTAAFEPVPANVARLLDNIRVNAIEGVVSVHPVALGAQSGRLRIEAAPGAENRVYLPGRSALAGLVEVDVRRLDEVLSDAPTLIKIDVEGYEFPVLQGAGDVLDAPDLLAVIVELANHGLRFGCRNQDVRSELERRGFREYSYDPHTRHLTPAMAGRTNAIFVRDEVVARKRLENAPRIWVPHIQGSI